MADDNNSRYRPSDAFARGPAQAGQPNDPLAELARLIGRSDPFSELGRDSRPPAPREHAAQDYQSQNYDPPPRYGSDPAPHYSSEPARDYPPRYGDDQPPPRLDWPGAPTPARPYAPDPFALPSQQSRMPEAPSYEGQSYADPHGQPVADSYQPDHSSHGPAFPPASDRPPFPQALYPREPEAGSMPPPHDDEFYDDAPRTDRRKGMLTVAAVLGLAVIGTGAALGYRSFFSGPSSSSPPPVIRAAGEPSKVAPPPQAPDQTASKFSYDRFGDRGQNEQVVLREEKPVDNRELGRTSVPRTVLPGAPNVAAQQPSAGSQSGAANPPSALGEPRRVRTVPIRPDQPDSAAIPRSAAPQQQAAPMPVAPPPARQQRSAAAETPANPPIDLSSPPPVNARAASARSNPRVAARSTLPAAPVEGNAPLSLSPDGNAPPPPAAAREPPPPRAAAPARVAAAGNGGRYLVQVSSQKSEADAQSSYRSLQSKYSNVLSGHRHIVRRADLGNRGIYYRAMVGPFGSRDEAIQLCTSLKAAGGDCVIQSN